MFVGNHDKCKKILEKGMELEAKPLDLINTAYKKFFMGKTKLLPDKLDVPCGVNLKETPLNSSIKTESKTTISQKETLSESKLKSFAAKESLGSFGSDTLSPVQAEDQSIGQADTADITPDSYMDTEQQQNSTGLSNRVQYLLHGSTGQM